MNVKFLKRKAKKPKGPKKPIILHGVALRDPNKKKMKRWKKVVLALVLVFMLLYLGQYVFLKWQMTKYDEDKYSCVGMSYDAEQFFESIGIHTIQRRVVGEHRWVAVEILGSYVDFEPTLNLLGFHLVTKGMEGAAIYQSEGFFNNGQTIKKVANSTELYTALTDWQKLGEETGTENSWILNFFP